MSGTESKRFFTKDGKLCRINTLHKRLLKDALIKKYHMKKKEAEKLNDFLLPMFEFCPEKRATAKQMLTHPWLNIDENDSDNYTMTEWEVEKMNLIEEAQKEKLSEDDEMIIIIIYIIARRNLSWLMKKIMIYMKKMRN